MTTIAFKDGIVAYDSRSTADNVIMSDNADKMTTERGVRFFIAGSPADFAAFFGLYFGETTEARGVSLSGLAVDGGVLYKIGVHHEEGFWKQRVSEDCPTALGSGYAHALTAMDMGATAKEAVKWASKRDSCTGGKIRTFRL